MQTPRLRHLVCLATLGLLSSAASAQITAELPFYDSFEGARTSPWWHLQATGSGAGKNTTLLAPATGQSSLVLGSVASGPSTVDATLALELAGETQVDLGFEHISYNDADDPVDGVWISDDGATWYQAQALNSTTGVSTSMHTAWVVDLDQAAAAAGMALTTPFYVRLSWAGQQAVPADGFGFDSLWVRRASSVTHQVPAQVATIQGALDAAANGDVVWVAPGTYAERIDFKGKAVSLIGVEGAGATKLQGPALSFHPDFPMDPVVRMVANEGRGSQVIGFTIEGAPPINDFAVGIWSVGAEPTVRDCRITNNEVGGVRGDGLFENCAISQNGNAGTSTLIQFGGGIHTDHGVLLNCTIRDNDGADGGGVWGAPTMVNCTVVDNTAWHGRGGGWYATGGVAYASAFRDNVAYDENPGGGIFGPGSVVDALVLGNVGGGGMACGSIGGAGINGARYVRNATVVGNDSGCFIPGTYPGGIKNVDQVVQSIVWNNTTFGTAPGSEQVWASGVTYSIVEGGFAGVGNSSADPLLDGQSKPGAGSPAVDGGHPGYPLDADGTLMDLGFYDVDAVDRNQNGYPDAFEFALLAASDCNANGFWDPIEAGSAVSTDFDGDGNPDDCVAPALNVDVTAVSLASGGEQVFTLAPPVGGELYVLVGSLASPPGSTPIGGLVVPLTADAYTTWILSNLGSPALTGFVGATVGSGTQSAKLSVPAGFNPALAGQTATHAYLTADPLTGAFTFVSNPVPLLLQ